MKRFIDTCRFADPWYFDLPPEMKCAWEYIWSSCDNAGVWQVNTKLADLQIGKKVDWPEFLKRCDGRIVEIPKGRWFVETFVRFQCGTLSENSRPHAVVIGLLRSHGLMKSDSIQIDYPIDYVRTIHSPQDKDKDQYKDKDQDQDTRTPAKISKDRGTIEEIKAFAIEIGQPESDGEACFHKWEGNGWVNGTAKIKDWRSTMRAWKSSGYLPSQKPVSRNGGKPAHAGEYPENIPCPIIQP